MNEDLFDGEVIIIKVARDWMKRSKRLISFLLLTF